MRVRPGGSLDDAAQTGEAKLERIDRSLAIEIERSRRAFAGKAAERPLHNLRTLGHRKIKLEGVVRVIGLISMMAAAAAAAPAKPPTKAPTPAQPVPLITQVVDAAYTGFLAQQADPFAATPKIPDAEGKPFKVALRLRSGDSSGIAPNDGYYTYEDGQLLLMMSKSSNPRPIYERDDTEVIYFNGINTPGKSYVGSNAFGASTRVSVQNWRRSALGVISIPPGEDFPWSRKQLARNAAMGFRGGANESTNYYPYQVDISGPEARTLVENVRVEIEGTMTALTSGKLADCVRRYSGPAIDAPYSITQTTCWVGANITRIAYVNSATGAVLKEFGGAATQAAQ